MHSGGRVYKRKVRTYKVELSEKDLDKLASEETVVVHSKGGAEVHISMKNNNKKTK